MLETVYKIDQYHFYGNAYENPNTVKFTYTHAFSPFDLCMSVCVAFLRHILLAICKFFLNKKFYGIFSIRQWEEWKKNNSIHLNRHDEAID